MNISVISNVTLEPHFSKNMASLSSNTVTVNSIMYEDNMDDRHFAKAESSEMILLWINVDSLYPDLRIRITDNLIDAETVAESVVLMYSQIIDGLREKNDKNIIIISQDEFDDKSDIFLGSIIKSTYIARIINNKTAITFSQSAVLINLNKIIAYTGINESYDSVNKYRWGAVYSEKLIAHATEEVYKQYLIYKGLTKKCVVLDCDNVLWGGILQEGGVRNIKLGGIGDGLYYQDFQRFILNLYHHGVILAVASKNDIDDVLDVFDNHSGMILKQKHISCFKVDWNNKADNIIGISKTLNISLDSIIFVDDSSFEIGLVKRTLPEVTTILFENNNDIYAQFNSLNLTDKIISGIADIRAKTYQSNQAREELLAKSINYDEYLKSLDMKIVIQKAADSELNRVVELSQRTNQCTNGTRYTAAELSDVVEKESNALYVVYVDDIFGSLGLVGAIIIKGYEIDLFCLSCRALGRNIEYEMILFIKRNHIVKNVKFKSTRKNDGIKEYLSKLFPIEKESC